MYVINVRKEKMNPLGEACDDSSEKKISFKKFQSTILNLSFAGNYYKPNFQPKYNFSNIKYSNFRLVFISVTAF